MAPVHSFRVVLTIEIHTIQIGEVTTVVPPGACIAQGTVAAVFVIITILGGKWHTTMIIKRITSGTYTKEKNSEIQVFGYFFLEVLHPVNLTFCNNNLPANLLRSDETLLNN